jgi:rhamnosyltransferase
MEQEDKRAIRMEAPMASVLLLTKNGEKYLDECLKGIFSQRVAFPYEVIAVDSGSTDRTLSILAHYPVRIQKINPKDFRHGRTRNLAAGLARGKFLVFLTQDATPLDDQWLGELVRAVEHTPDAAGAYSRWLSRPEGHVLEKILVEKIFTSENRIQRQMDSDPIVNKNQKRRLIFFSNVSSCVRENVWRQIPFDNEMFFAEDQRWAKQVIKTGASIVYVPSSKVYHSHNDSWGVSAKKFFESGVAFGRMSETRKVPAEISFSELFRSIVREGERQGKGPLGIFFMMGETFGRCLWIEIFNQFGFFYGMFLKMTAGKIFQGPQKGRPIL